MWKPITMRVMVVEMIKYYLEQLTDRYTRDNFEKTQTTLNKNAINSSEFKHFSLSIDQAHTHFKYKHNLGYVPKDIIQTASTGSAVTFNYKLFDNEYFDITTTGSCSIRFFAGRYQED